MPDRQLLAEAQRLRAEVAEARATLAALRDRQQEAISLWEKVISHLMPV